MAEGSSEWKQAVLMVLYHFNKCLSRNNPNVWWLRFFMPILQAATRIKSVVNPGDATGEIIPGSLCARKMASSVRLRLHRTQSRRFRYECPLCGKAMGRPRDVRAHMASKHNMRKDFKCDLCGAEYGYKYNLQQHMKVRHNINIVKN